MMLTPTPHFVQAGAAGGPTRLSSAMAVSMAARSAAAAPCLLRRPHACRYPQPPQPPPLKRLTLRPTPLLAAASGARARLTCGKAQTARSAVGERAAAPAACSNGSVQRALTSRAMTSPFFFVCRFDCVGYVWES